MNIKQERFVYARIKDYDRRLRELEKLMNVHSASEASPQADGPVSSVDDQGGQTEALQSLEARNTLTA